MKLLVVFTKIELDRGRLTNPLLQSFHKIKLQKRFAIPIAIPVPIPIPILMKYRLGPIPNPIFVFHTFSTKFELKSFK
jgi:hypothetical protein